MINNLAEHGLRKQAIIESIVVIGQRYGGQLQINWNWPVACFGKEHKKLKHELTFALKKIINVLR